MRSKVLATIVVVQFVVICALGFLLFQGGRPAAERERVEAALTDIHGTLSVGANFTQLQGEGPGACRCRRSFPGQGWTRKRAGSIRAVTKTLQGQRRPLE